MRAVKSAAEVALIERAVAATTAGFEAALRFIRPGVTERAIAGVVTAAFRSFGGDAAFEPIVGSGANGTVLHYTDLGRTLEDGDLVVIDYGASFGGYASDVTRTFPANGRFTVEQRALYEVVLEANLAAMAAARPGATTSEVERAAGMVHTIEPGIYLPNRGVGIRIEDDILITESGNVNLTAAIPKTVEAIEAAMAAR
jgi:Xaa-Pro aminopeptidase